MTTTAHPSYEPLSSVGEEGYRLQRLVDGLPVGVYRSTPSGQILTVNPAMSSLLGIPAADLLRLNAADFYADPADRDRWQTQMDRDGLVRAFDFRVRRADGQVIWVRDTAHAVRDDDGRVLYYEGVLEDITERKRVREALRESETRSESIFENAPIGMAIVALDGRFMKVNPAFCEMLGYTAEEMTAITIFDITHPEDNARAQPEREQLFRGLRSIYKAERRYVKKSGQVVWTRLTARVVLDAEQKPLYALGMIEDIDEQRRARIALEEAHGRLTRSMDELTQRSRRITLLTEMTDLLQSSRTTDEAYEILQACLPDLFSADAGAVYIQSASRKSLEAVAAWGTHEADRVFAPDDCWAVRRGRSHLASGKGPMCPHVQFLAPACSLCIPMSAQGETLGVLTLAHSSADAAKESCRQRAHDEDAERLFASTVAEHVALALANLRLRESLKSQSIRDPLTGLFNRRYMEETLERELHRAVRRKASVGVVMFDIDHFKQFNDTHGHLAGDAMLRALGEFLQANFRGEDIACRYGGEEFVLILPEAPLEAAARRADTLRERARVLHVPHLGMLLGGITLSCGVSAYPQHGDTVEALIRSADSALYLAKSGGRDRVVTQK
ncbi:MAG: diguanylate cyclase [Armatimonadota bacterium]|nr:diguanylate cyclase [Armatimonadota bacterium]